MTGSDIQTSLTHRRHPGGFTLVELLVVAVIVSMLAVIGIGVTRAAIRRSHQVACMGNLRNIGAAMHLYAQDNGGLLPGTTHTTTLEKAWIYELENHLGRFDESRICPADPKKHNRLAARGTSYILNSLVFVPQTDAFGRPRGKTYNRLANIPDPSRTLLAVVCSDHIGVSPGNDHTHSDRWTSWAAVCRDVAPDRHGEASADRTRGGSNYLFADGHVGFITAMNLKRRVESGDNPAVPPDPNP